MAITKSSGTHRKLLGSNRDQSQQTRFRRVVGFSDMRLGSICMKNGVFSNFICFTKRSSGNLPITRLFKHLTTRGVTTRPGKLAPGQYTTSLTARFPTCWTIRGVDCPECARLSEESLVAARRSCSRQRRPEAHPQKGSKLCSQKTQFNETGTSSEGRAPPLFTTYHEPSQLALSFGWRRSRRSGHLTVRNPEQGPVKRDYR